jgi:hypothetical protein
MKKLFALAVLAATMLSFAPNLYSQHLPPPPPPKPHMW